MKIAVARSAGFCWGVKRAVDRVLEGVDRGDGPFYSFGPLIHNPQTLQVLQQKGVVVVDDPAQAVGGTLAIRSHGVAPQVRRDLKTMELDLIDGTCPHVGMIQSHVKKFAGRGYQVVIIGDHRHAEVVGLLGYADGHAHVVDTVEEVASLPPMEQVAVVTQSTHDRESTERVTGAIRARFPQAVVVDTLCDVTDGRQQELRERAGEVDRVVVVGGRASANTTRLATIAEEEGVQAYHIETPEELRPDWFEGARSVLVTAGASTPQWMTDRVVDRLHAIDRELNGAASHSMSAAAPRWLPRAAARSLTGLGAAGLTYAAAALMGVPSGAWALLAAALAMVGLYTSSRFADRESAAFESVFGTSASGGRLGVLKRWVARATLLGALASAALVGWPVVAAVAITYALGLAYHLARLPGPLATRLGAWRLRDVAGSKDLASALAWTAIPVGVAASSAGPLGGPWPGAASVAVATIFALGLGFVRSLLMDVMRLQSDRLVGREATPVLLGKRRSKSLLAAVCAAIPAVLALGVLTHSAVPAVAAALVACVAYACAYLWAFHRRWLGAGLACEVVADANLLLAGLLACAALRLGEGG